MSKEQRDLAVRHRIEKLVNEEHSLHLKRTLSSGNQQRLNAIRVELDQCWDVLSRCEALRESGKRPE